jgi:DNA invertase Pin-like site-specific DNA recombinase
MIGQTIPDQHKAAMAQLSSQIDHYLATGERIQLIPTGQSGEKGLTATSNHPKNLRAKRDVHAPRVRDMAAKGMTASAIATAMSLDSRTIRRIASENQITLAEPT